MTIHTLIQGGGLYFDAWVGGAPSGNERLLACSGQVSQAQDTTDVPTYCNDEGLIEKADDAVARVDRSVLAAIKDVIMDNIAFVFLGSAAVATIALSATETESFTSVTQGQWRQIGATSTYPEGTRQISSFSITSPISCVEGTDYEVDLVNARWRPLAGSAKIADDSDVDIQYDQDAATVGRVITSNDTAVGSLRLVGVAGAKGDPKSYFYYKVRVRPDGEYVLKADPNNPADTEIGLRFEVLKVASIPAVIATDYPVAT